MAEAAAPSKKTIPVVPILACAFALGYLGYQLIHVLTPFLLSMALAYLINPFINTLQAHGLRRDFVVVTIYVVFISLLAAAFHVLAPAVSAEFSELQAQIPSWVKGLNDFLARAEMRLAKSMLPGSDMAKGWTTQLYDNAIHQIQNLPSIFVGILPFLSLFFLVPFIAFFLLLDGQRTIGGLIQACPSRLVEQALYLLSEIETSLGNYLRGLMIVVAAIAAASWIGLTAMGVNYATAIAILAGVSSLVPYLGAVMGAVVGGIAAGVQFGTVTAGLKVVALFFGIRLADEAFVQPFVSKHAVRLHPLVYLLSLMVGGEVFGFIGLVFAVPAACVLKALGTVAWDWYSTETLIEATAHVESSVRPYT